MAGHFQSILLKNSKCNRPELCAFTAIKNQSCTPRWPSHPNRSSFNLRLASTATDDTPHRYTLGFPANPNT
jgi:hypothetical protein